MNIKSKTTTTTTIAPSFIAPQKITATTIPITNHLVQSADPGKTSVDTGTSDGKSLPNWTIQRLLLCPTRIVLKTWLHPPPEKLFYHNNNRIKMRNRTNWKRWRLPCWRARPIKIFTFTDVRAIRRPLNCRIWILSLILQCSIAIILTIRQRLKISILKLIRLIAFGKAFSDSLMNFM